MNAAGIVLAAGLSSRMGEFKPLLPLGNRNFAETVLHSLRLAGCQELYLVCGYHAEELQNAIRNIPVHYLLNAEYERTDMAASAKIGFQAVDVKFDSILLTLVDIPLFHPETAASLLRVSAPLVIPRYEGRKGHPIALSGQAVHALCEDGCQGGLKESFKRCGLEPVYIETDDPWILEDADTPEQYAIMREAASRQ